jgi:hypothetical protein
VAFDQSAAVPAMSPAACRARKASALRRAAAPIASVAERLGPVESQGISVLAQSGERIRGRHNVQASRFAQPNKKRFTVRRILGSADLWITELVLTYDGQPSYTVSIMEFRDGKMVREIQYFGEPFEPGPSRVQWVERML